MTFKFFELGLIAVLNDFEIFELGFIAVQNGLALLPCTSVINLYAKILSSHKKKK